MAQWPKIAPARAAALAAAVLTLLGAHFAASAAAARGPDDAPPRAELATTGNHSELVETIPITSVPGADQQVVMSLGPDELRPLHPGDRLRVSAEFQVSTTCVSEGPRCVGTRYDFNPIVGAQIVLSAAPEVGVASVPLSAPQQVRCKQRRPNRNHHCTLVFPNLETTIGDPSTLPCPPTDCYVNLLVGASNPAAVPGNVLVVGADRPDGSTEADKGRLNVVQAGANVPPPRTSSSVALVNPTVPLLKTESVDRRVVYSVPIPAPKEGEVLAFDGSYVAGIAALRYNVFVSSRVLVAETPTSVQSTGVAAEATQFHGKATEENGFNCTKGRSGYRDPCTSTKAGVITFTKDAVDAGGQPVTLYLNLVVGASPTSSDVAPDIDRAGLQPAAGLNLFRY